MPKKIDLTNQIFGEWLVLREATKDEKQNKPGSYWLCRCSCGTEKIVNGQLLREHQSNSCGCQTAKYLSIAHKNKNCIDISGQRFGKLIVLNRDYQTEQQHKNNHNTYWLCQCDCGNKISVMKSSLTMGKTISCGCYRKEIASKNLSQISSNNYIDETNNRYGKLMVLYKSNIKHPTREGVIWHCKCDCGNECDVFGVDLRKGTVTSCGCLGKSKGEYNIEQLLKNNNICYSKEYSVKINNIYYRFDFAIFLDNQLLYFIEFDGKQHYEPCNLFDNEIGLLKTQERDVLKNQWCKNNNIPLIRIPYWHLKDLKLEDLLLKTSEYIING